MNKKKIILTASAVFVVAAGVFAGMRKVSPTSIYVKRSAGTGTCILLVNNNQAANFTSTSGTHQATIRTIGGGLNPLFSTSGCGTTHKVYWTN